MSLRDDALEMHRENQGKLEITPNVKVTNKQQLSLAYSPGVAEPCKEIHEDSRKVYEYTIKRKYSCCCNGWNSCSRFREYWSRSKYSSNGRKGSTVQKFAGINGVPIALDTTDTQEIIKQ